MTDEVREYGVRTLETGGFLLLPSGDHKVTTVAVVGEVGIVRRYNLFEISALAIDRLFNFADSNGLLAPIQFHSHQLGNLLSLTDERHGFCVEGFTSVVVPHFRDPSDDVGEWGWWTFETGRWVTAQPAILCDGFVRRVRFDEDSVRDA